MLTVNGSVSRFDDMDLARENRRHRRHRVYLQVRFGSAADYLVEYAENLSRGGMFVRNLTDLEPLSTVELELDLPGYCKFHIKARVAHCRSRHDAETWGGHAGAGLEIIESPEGFDEALYSYLRQLGRRRDYTVLVADRHATALLDSAGYRVLPLPPPGAVQAFIDQLESPPLAIVVDRDRVSSYMATEDLADYIVELDKAGVVDQILTKLDVRIHSWR